MATRTNKTTGTDETTGTGEPTAPKRTRTSKTQAARDEAPARDARADDGSSTPEAEGGLGEPRGDRSAGASAKAEAAGRIKVTQLRSGIGFDKKQTLALRGLGLRRIRQTVEVEDTPAVRGLILKVRHLVQVEEEGR